MRIKPHAIETVRGEDSIQPALSHCYPGATPTEKKNGLPEGKPLICLVAGEGFEPSTFGL